VALSILRKRFDDPVAGRFMTSIKKSNRQKSTDSTTTALTVPQNRMITAIASGASISAAAETAGCDRTSFYLWRRDPEFATELNRAIWEQRLSFQSEIQQLAPRALEALKKLLEQESTPPNIRMQTALQILRASGSLDTPPIGSTDEDAMRHELLEREFNAMTDKLFHG